MVSMEHPCQNLCEVPLSATPSSQGLLPKCILNIILFTFLVVDNEQTNIGQELKDIGRKYVLNSFSRAALCRISQQQQPAIMPFDCTEQKSQYPPCYPSLKKSNFQFKTTC